MRLIKSKIFKLSVFCALALTSCGGSSIPSIGYSKYKDMNSQYLISIGGKGNEITYNSCNYVHITGDGELEAGDLVGVVYYRINWTLKLASGSTSETVYATYYNSFDAIYEEKSSELYSYAYSLVSEGALDGVIGNL